MKLYDGGVIMWILLVAGMIAAGILTDGCKFSAKEIYVDPDASIHSEVANNGKEKF